MSDDLVKRLRDSTEFYHGDCELKMQAADRIEELEKQIRTDALQYLSDVGQMQDKIADDTQTIKIIDMIEHEDGSATVTLDITQRTAKTLLEIGFLKLLEDHIKEAENNYEPDSE